MARPSTISPGEAKYFAREYENGSSIRELALKYGLTYIGVRYRLQLAGVKFRPRGRKGLK